MIVKGSHNILTQTKILDSTYSMILFFPVHIHRKVMYKNVNNHLCHHLHHHHTFKLFLNEHVFISPALASLPWNPDPISICLSSILTWKPIILLFIHSFIHLIIHLFTHSFNKYKERACIMCQALFKVLRIEQWIKWTNNSALMECTF